jgi:hypothetical protein
VLPAVYWYARRAHPTPAVEIFRGVAYECRLLPTSADGGGLVHLARIELQAPGVDLFTTPLDADAVAVGWEYKLERPAAAAAREELAVLINGTLFTSDSGWLPRSGDLARSRETIVSNHAVNHVDLHSYLMWFENDLTPHLELDKPPPDAALMAARLGMSGQQVVLFGGAPGNELNRLVDRRTMLAINPQRKLLWLAVFEQASYLLAAQTLAAEGATLGTMLDGGDSSALVVGSGAAHVDSGCKIGGWRPVATFFGVRATPR